MSNWGKILLFILILLAVVIFFRGVPSLKKEGFVQNDNFLFKSGTEVYDDFYANIYDYLVYSNLKNDYEVGEIINRTRPTQQSIILDIGSGTGHHVASLAAQGFNVQGVDVSEAMVKKAQTNYPQYNFKTGDVLNPLLFNDVYFTHILCLYFTIYYIEDKATFFNNCINWLMPGGYLILHVVDRELFDPILPPGNPLLLVSPQRYAKERITSTKVSFNDLHYSSDFNLIPDSNTATFEEKFEFKDGGKVRKNEHTFYMETEQDIITMAQNAGFIIDGKIDMLKCHYEYQYLYILLKPQ
jgi:SAM-dependent methyltransferase